MSPELIFWLSLIAKMAITACFVVMAIITAERAGPLVGGLVTTLPISTGPVFIVLALDHDSHFIASAAITTLTGNAINCVLALVYALLAQKRSVAISWSAAFAMWMLMTWLSYFVQWDLLTASLLNVITIGVGLWLVRPLRKVRVQPPKVLWYHLAFRGAAVASLVGASVALSVSLGPKLSGTLAMLPVVMSSVAIVLHRTLSGPASAAVIANAILGLIGLALGTAALHLTAEPLGNSLALALALIIAVGGNGLIYAAQQRGFPI